MRFLLRPLALVAVPLPLVVYVWHLWACYDEERTSWSDAIVGVRSTKKPTLNHSVGMGFCSFASCRFVVKTIQPLHWWHKPSVALLSDALRVSIGMANGAPDTDEMPCVNCL